MSAKPGKWLFAVSACLLLLAAVPSAQAGTGSCSDTWTASCTAAANNICPAANPCTITITHNSQGVAVAQVNGQTQTYVCVYAGQSVQWTESGGSFSSTFASAATPFNGGTTSFSPTSNTGTISTGAKGSCSQFSMTETVGGSTYHGDPKVVVHP